MKKGDYVFYPYKDGYKIGVLLHLHRQCAIVVPFARRRNEQDEDLWMVDAGKLLELK